MDDHSHLNGHREIVNGEIFWESPLRIPNLGDVAAYDPSLLVCFEFFLEAAVCSVVLSKIHFDLGNCYMGFLDRNGPSSWRMVSPAYAHTKSVNYVILPFAYGNYHTRVETTEN
jgi:hypothetical protein